MTFSSPKNVVSQVQRTKESQHTTLKEYKTIREKGHNAAYLRDGIVEGKTASSLVGILVSGDRLQFRALPLASI